MRRLAILVFILLLAGYTSYAQEVEWRDSLRAAIKVDTRKVARTIGGLSSDMKGIRSVASPLGEGDPIKWVQGLPGVTTGADGSSAFYVRGGNMGNNLFSIDGVPVYGFSHLLGLTTIVPTTAMGEVTLSKGGFEGSESNFTSSHLKIVSRDPGREKGTSVALNSFLVSASHEGAVNDRVSYMTSLRASPMALEYSAVRRMLPEILGGLDNFSAGVGDLYGKVHVALDGGSTLDVSGMGSADYYYFAPDEDSRDTMEWNNAFGQIRYRIKGDTDSNYAFYVNHYGSLQKQDRIFRDKINHLMLNSDLTEVSVAADWRRAGAGSTTLSWGSRLRGALFRPGRVASVHNDAWTLLANAYVQAEHTLPDLLDLRGYFRSNAFFNLKNGGMNFNPEGGASAKWHLGHHFAVEVSADRLVQYYHTLEGLPVGWSLDMIVPSGKQIKPESVLQGSLGLSAAIGRHTISIGGFYKWMEDLVYYKYSQSLFSGGMADWENNVEQGLGRSYGLEALYEYQSGDFYTRTSYTLSRTDRRGFPSICGGGVFHARFDRRHVFNAVAQWKGASAAFILQSGNWENGASQKYDMTIPGAELMADYYFGVNNYQMPMVLRLDLGYQFSFTTGRVAHEVNVGVCNVTNHFNPFMIYFDSKTETWYQLALLPILPNFSWRLSF
ncbi:MAG: TonB-dependent receptor plug domain-containing protein [Bacteroidales bacterium]|nr:TonB-dependent receptor plug domain-containing protein [Bacteroidales bacterium]